jgi:hypothetical protein
VTFGLRFLHAMRIRRHHPAPRLTFGLLSSVTFGLLSSVTFGLLFLLACAFGAIIQQRRPCL